MLPIFDDMGFIANGPDHFSKRRSSVPCGRLSLPLLIINTLHVAIVTTHALAHTRTMAAVSSGQNQLVAK